MKKVKFASRLQVEGSNFSNRKWFWFYWNCPLKKKSNSQHAHTHIICHRCTLTVLDCDADKFLNISILYTFIGEAGELSIFYVFFSRSEHGFQAFKLIFNIRTVFIRNTFSNWISYGFEMPLQQQQWLCCFCVHISIDAYSIQNKNWLVKIRWNLLNRNSNNKCKRKKINRMKAKLTKTHMDRSIDALVVVH